MLIAFYENAQDATPRPREVTWPELAAMLTAHRVSDCPNLPCPGGRCPAKNGPAWSPVDIVDRRRTENVRGVTVAVFDIDHLPEARLEVLENVERRGLAFALHSTHSHRPPDDYCLRLVIPLSRTVLPREWPQVRSAAIRMLELPADEATKDLARLYFLPDAPRGSEAVAIRGEGKPLDVDDLLAAARAGAPAGIPAPIPELPPDSGPADMFELRSLLRRVRKPEHLAIVRRVLAGEPLAPRGQQDNTLNALMSCAAFVLPVETPEEVVIALFHPSFRATDWGEGTEHLCAQAIDKLRRHRERRKARDAERLAENESIWRALGTKPPAVQTPSQRAEVVEEDDPDPEAWGKDLITETSRTGETRLRNCEANVFTVLLASPEWRGVIRFNESTKRLELEGGPLPPNVSVDTLDVEIANWMQRSEYGVLGLRPKPMVVAQQMLAVASRNAYDPVADYLNGLVWDGKPRLDAMLIERFGALGDEDHLRTISARFGISCVARALKPGCKVDTVLILEGPQGLKKSTAFRELSTPWFSDAPIDVNNKDSAMLASQFWFIEIAELSGFRRAENQALKAFISRLEDTYRPPYGRTNVKTPRRCVFVGSTNDDNYLKDPTGHRRFWPVTCTRIDIEGIRRDRDQLWAESVVRFHQGEQWWLTAEEAARAEKQAALRADNSGEGQQEAILQWILAMPKEKRPTEVSLLQVARDALQMPVANIDGRKVPEVIKALHALGFTPAVRRADGRRPRVYVTPKDLLEALQETPGQRKPPLTVVAESAAR